jgi:CRISPR-associated protein Cst2
MMKTAALEEVLGVFADEILSDVYVGWVQGYLDEERAGFEGWAANQERVKICHPRQAFQAIIEVLGRNRSWLA